MPRREPSELTLIVLVAAVQFVNILDFMIVMPLGPDFARALDIPQSHLGYIGGSYTAAAALSGLAGSFFLDRFDRRKALGVAMAGLVIGTALGGVAEMVARLPLLESAALAANTPPRLASLMFARVVAGLFGGPATSLAFSIIADRIPPERRGKAMGIVMGAFSMASVFGVPAGLKLARHGGWRLPFFAVAALGGVLVAAAIFLLPPLTTHLEAARGKAQVRIGDLLGKPLVLLSYTMTANVMMAGFILIPNISAYVQGNLGYPRADVETLYMAGGLVSLVATQLGGRVVDKIGAFRTALGGTALLVGVIACGFVATPPLIPVLAVFMSFMLAMGFRNVSHTTLASRVPAAHERARFLSLQSAAQHLAASSGSFVSARMLGEQGGMLVGMRAVALVSIGLSCTVPALMWLVERGVLRREREARDGVVDGAPAPAAGG